MSLWDQMTSIRKAFKDIVKEHIDGLEGAEYTSDDYVEFDEYNTMKELYDSLPWSIQRCIHFRYQPLNGHSLQLRLDSELLVRGDDELMGLRFHQQLTQDEERAIKQQFINEAVDEKYTDEFIHLNRHGEFVVKSSNLNEFILYSVNYQMGSHLKYIRELDQGENLYAIYMEAGEVDPIRNRFDFLKERLHMDCPNCGEEDSFRFIHTCKSCGIAIEPNFLDRAVDELNPDISLEDYKKAISKWSKEVLEDGSYIDIETELELVGETQSLEVYENDGVFEETDGLELWVNPSNAPVLFYSINDGFIFSDSADQEQCLMCNMEKRCKRVDGAYYAKGAGLLQNRIPICPECESEITAQLYEILRQSSKTPKYISAVV